MASTQSQRHPSRPRRSSSFDSFSNHDNIINRDQSGRHRSASQSPREGVSTMEIQLPCILDRSTFVQNQKQTRDQVEPRRCWICLQDESEDVTHTSEWRSPCKCKLQAHEECLLEWIADLETPKRDNPQPAQILCPQCKSKIKVARPRDYIVLAVDCMRNVVEMIRVPAQISAVIGCLVSSSLVYGLNAVQVVFGTEDTIRLLRVGAIGPVGPGALQSYGGGLLDKLFRTVLYTDPLLPSNCLVGWGPFAFVLPFVAPALILSRTRLADFTSVLIPLPYLVYGAEHGGLRQWPPGPGLTFAVLPYIRLAYFELYRHTFARLENKWDRALLRNPREGETTDQLAQDQLERHHQDHEDLIMDVELVVGREERHRVRAEPNFPQIQADHIAGQAAPNNAQPEAQAGRQGQPGNGQAGRAVEWRQGISIHSVATSLMGALFFPAISSLMGDLLKVTIQKVWARKPGHPTLPFFPHTNGNFNVGARGLLQEKWGRSVVGGCLFIVLRDALTLYCKWRKAQIQQKRRVLDYVENGADTSRGKNMGGGSVFR